MNNDDVDVLCSFCGKSQEEVQKLIAGPEVYICNECIALCQDIIAEEIKDDCCTTEYLEGKYIHQILTWHFQYANKADIESCSYETTFKHRIYPELLIDQWLESNNYKYKRIGVSRKYYGRDEFLSFSELWEDKIHPIYLGPAQYYLTGLTEGISKQLKNGLWLCSNEQTRFIIYMDQGRSNPNHNTTNLYLEIATVKNEVPEVSQFFSDIKNEFEPNKHNHHND